MTDMVTSNLSAGVLTITLADAPKRNALSSRLVAHLLEALDQAGSNEAVRVVVLTNEGSVFCAGVDLAERSEGKTADVAGLFKRILDFPKPLIGRIAGHAVAGGTGLAAALDISVAVEDVNFGFTEVRLGLAPAIISLVCLPKMSRAGAAAAFLRGTRFDAVEAVRLGLINYAVPAADLDSRVAEIVDDLLAGGPNALAATKRLMRTVPQMEFDEAMEWAANLSDHLFDTPEGREGMAAYLEKRPPAWMAPG